MKAIKILIAVFATLALFSCTKDIEFNPIGPDGKKKLSDDQVFWNVVGKLVGTDQMTPDYKGKTFTPTIGSPDNGDPSVRIVAVNNLLAAVTRYNTLTGASIDVNTASNTWSNPAIGSLTWNKGDGTTCWGTVDVSIPAVPSLQKIIYRSPEQGDTNGSVGDNGSAYYRFGDVIARTRPADTKGGTTFPAITEYWVCVRPAFGPEGKGDSHWVSLSPLPRENVWPYNDDDYNYGPYVGSNGKNYGMPTCLGDDLEWLQDLNEMLYAIACAGYPTEGYGSWFSNAHNYYSSGWFGPDGLLIFNDFVPDNLKYHNTFFWENVKNGWERFGIAQKLFGTEDGGNIHNLKWIENRVKNGGEGLRYLHTGYSWWVSWWDNEPDVYQATYKSVITDDHTQLNMHYKKLETVEKQVTFPSDKSNPGIYFNVKEECTEQKPFLINREFFGDAEPRFIYRYKTGEELLKMVNASTKWNPQFALEGYTEVYRYYGNGGFEPNKILTQPPEETPWTSVPYEDEHGYFYPGCIVKDDKGSNWLCYYGWHKETENEPLPDHYARFVSFDNINVAADATGAKVITNDDLIPEDEVFVAALMLAAIFNEDSRANPGYGQTFKDIRAKIKEFCNYDTANRVVVRDSTQTGWISALNLVYEPRGFFPGSTDLRKPGGQPYMRMVIDGSDSNGSLKKWFYYRYNNPDNDQSCATGQLDLSHLFKYNNSTITASKPILPDKWSQCKRHDNGKREGCISFNDLWGGQLDVSRFISNSSQYQSAYKEPVIVARYMEIDDPYANTMPTLTEDGRKLTPLFDPKGDVMTYYDIPKKCLHTDKTNTAFVDSKPYPLIVH